MNYYNKNNVLSNYPDVLTVDTLSTILHVSRTTCYSLIKNNEIRSIRIGNQIRIPKVYLCDYLFRKEPMAV
ncbi:MAG: helix-turn-helix domain-containing protein [Clostridia bacterium]|nr:helix-turn-helix domain-containing protein [Clostridia bacterium]